MKMILYWLMALNLAFFTFEYFYGTHIDSIAIISDSIDGFTDSVALLLGLLSVSIPLHRKLLVFWNRTFFLDDLFKSPN
jgi:Co/Zn/Cd efflux system component